MDCICGEKGCNGLCDYAIGGRVFRLLNESTTIKSNIGDTSKDLSTGKTLLVVGHQVYKTDSPSKIMKFSKGITLSVENKLSGIGEANSYRALSAFIERNGLDKEMLNSLKDIESRKLLFMPFKPGQVCKIRVFTEEENSKGRSKSIEVETEISSIRWGIENIEGREVSTTNHQIVTDYVDARTRKRAIAKLEEYNDRFYMVDLEINRTKEIRDLQLIRFSKFGYAYPIELSKGSLNLIIDNSNVYIKAKNTESVTLAGVWKDSKIELDKQLSSWAGIGKLVEVLTRSQSYIARYRKYIAPYLTAETNYIEL